MTPPDLHNGALREAIDPSLLGTATLDKAGAFETGSYQSFMLTYAA